MEFKKIKSKQTSLENLTKIDEINRLSKKLEDKLGINAEEIHQKEITKMNMELEKQEKKNYTISLSKKVIIELEEFLGDFGDFGETKSSFIQEAITQSIQNRKKQMKERLLDKIKKLEG
ncbi:hypothetical protein [Helicobacter sp. 13S00477-4]|uniref:hypothetical protein n=1 Tax=Helicobacter sp. 13S00477-4 TaxID=1905759 RepID=UPI000BA5EC66|nr:hypothetical protein [Helicobacter sp. 13S00477-4]PAF50473.1 hypothetical protein BKH44_08150 [Helicobacter sp. 13S00477-4]